MTTFTSRFNKRNFFVYLFSTWLIVVTVVKCLNTEPVKNSSYQLQISEQIHRHLLTGKSSNVSILPLNASTITDNNTTAIHGSMPSNLMMMTTKDITGSSDSAIHDDILDDADITPTRKLPTTTTKNTTVLNFNIGSVIEGSSPPENMTEKLINNKTTNLLDSAINLNSIMSNLSSGLGTNIGSSNNNTMFANKTTYNPSARPVVSSAMYSRVKFNNISLEHDAERLTTIKNITLLDFMKPSQSQGNELPVQQTIFKEIPTLSQGQERSKSPKDFNTSVDPTLISFFEEDGKREDDREYITEPQQENSRSEHLINNPILSDLITGNEIEGLNNDNMLSDPQDMFEIRSNVVEKPTNSSFMNEGYAVDLSEQQQLLNTTVSTKTPALTQNARVDLEDPDDYIYHMQQDDESIEELTKNIKTNYEGNQSSINDLIKSFHVLFNHTNKGTHQKLSNNPIQFITVNPATDAHCMDGSTPGFYLRKGFNKGKNKWIIHLHGGAWCYDLRSCSKRRNTILGSTRRSFDEDITGFFHGILSNDKNINPHFYNWNAVVFSYCDGGLFSGNRDNILKGRNKRFYFQGRKILKSQLQSLQKHSLLTANEIILSGTSAGALALILQGNFIKRFLPQNAKVRGLIDAGMFLDQDSIWNSSISSLQFKALYSLHRPTLSRKCLEKQPLGKKYKCLFPENTIKYLNIPIFIVNSLYDHWQLSYLQGIYCVYDDHKCRQTAHDRILGFRNKIYRALNNVVEDKQDTGVFANSCLAHGQVILDYTWSQVKINHRTISDSFFDWYKDEHINNKASKRHLRMDCKYPCNGSCPRVLAQRCVNNFKKASENRRKRDAELC